MQLLLTALTTLTLISILGIVIAFSPTLVLTELAILTRSKRPVVHTIAFISGITLAVLVFCLGAMLLVDPSRELSPPSINTDIKLGPLADVVIGILLIATGVHLLRPKSSSSTKGHHFKPEKLLSSKALFWFGFIKLGTSLSSITAILLAARFITSSIHTDTLQLASAFLLIAVAVSPFILILLLQQLRPRTFAKIQAASDKAVGVNWRRIIAFSLMTLGGYLVLSAATLIV